MPRFNRYATVSLAVAMLASCSAAPPPAPPAPPPTPVGSTDLRDAIHKPIDKAKSVDDTLEKEKEKQDKQLQDAGG